MDAGTHRRAAGRLIGAAGAILVFLSLKLLLLTIGGLLVPSLLPVLLAAGTRGAWGSWGSRGATWLLWRGIAAITAIAGPIIVLWSIILSHRSMSFSRFCSPIIYYVALASKIEESMRDKLLDLRTLVA